MKKLTLSCLIVFSHLMSSSLHAENNSYLSLETSSDNASGNDVYLTSGIDFIGASQLLLSYGKSDSNSVTTDSYSIGITSDPMAKFSSGLSYLYWQQENAMDISTFQLTLNSNTDDWSFSVSPELRIITIYPLTAPAVDFNSTGIGFSAAYYGAFPLFVSAGFKFYSYDRNVSVLNTNQYPMFTMRHFSSATLDQASGLEDNRFTFDTGYNFSRFTLGYYHDRSTSAVDDSTYTSNSVYGRLKLTDNWQLGLETGRSKNSLPPADSISFSRASITYNW